MNVKLVVAIILMGLVLSGLSVYLALTRVLPALTVAAEEQAEPELKRIREAERCIEAGNPQEALSLVKNIRVLRSNRGCHLTLIQAAAACMQEGNCDRVMADVEQGEFTPMIHNSKELRGKLVRYSEAVKKHRSARSAAALIKMALHMDLWLSPHSDVQFRYAEYCLEGGDKKKAAALCQRLWEDGIDNNWKWSYVDNDLTFKRKLQELKEKAGASNEKWLTAMMIKPFPTNSVIYLQPLGDVNTNVLYQVGVRIQRFFGASTKILAPLPLTRQEASYMPYGDKYDADRLRPDMLKRLRIPSDAFSVVMLTQQKIGTSDYDWIYAQSTKNGHLVSSYIWLKWDPYWQVITISNVAISNISRQLGLRGVFPCITASSGDSDTMRRAKFAYSPEIQEKYRKLDLAAAQRRSIEDYRRWGATIMEP